MIIDSKFKVANLLKNRGTKRIVFTNGCFDVLHVGHLRSFQAARALGDLFIVGVNSDSSVRSLKGDSRPINNQDNRVEMLEGFAAIDGVIIYDGERSVEAINYVRPDIYVKSGDYNLENLDKSELKALQDINAKIIFTPFFSGYSSSSILNEFSKQI